MPNPSTDQLLLAALQLHQSGRAADAAQIYRQILTLHPDHPEALHRLGVIAAQARNFDEAEILFRRSLAVSPQNPVYHYNLGNVLRDRRQYDAAAAAYRQALQLQPHYVEALYHLGITLRSLSQFAPAAAAFRHALQLNPNFADAHCALGNALWYLGQLDAAIASYRTALQLKPNYADAWGNLANALKDVALHDEAFTAYRRALELRPDSAATHSNLLVALNYHPAVDDRAILQEARCWNDRHARPLAPPIQPYPNDRTPERRLRIGYVSADFRNHVSDLFLLPLLSAHDHACVEVYCYAHVPRPDDLTQRFQTLADQWRPCADLSDAQLAEQIRRDRIDILVDLKLHTESHRLLVFARKPAPVQVTWLGYPGTTGLDAIDYRFTDPHLDPPGRHDDRYAERSLRLPDCFWCYDPRSADPPVQSLPALQSGRITFGCLNNAAKFNVALLDAWAAVLQAVPAARLILLAQPGAIRSRICRQMQNAGLDPDRLEFVERRPRLQYLELYHRLDIALDTFPCNGHTTTLDALWMGVPVITLRGEKIVGRAGFSQLTNLGMTEWIAHSHAEYIGRAVALAADLPRLTHLRATLRPQLQSSPLMDAPRFARHIESAYRQIWRKWCVQALALR